MPTPVSIRGTVYPSAKDAAEALGVSQQAIYSALDRGTVDNVGLGSGKMPTSHEGISTLNSKPIKIGPLEFRSMAEASSYIGKSSGYVKTMVRRGRLDLVTAHVMRTYAQQENRTRVQENSFEGDEDAV